MSVLSRLRPTLFLAAIAVAATAALGADPAAAPPASGASAAPAAQFGDRLFFAFAQEANLVKSQWWEGQIEYNEGGDDFPVNTFLARGVVAFRPVQTLEVGGRVGFGTTHASGAGLDGSGATDLDIYGKWVFPNVGQNLDFSVGLLATIPTGDDTAGLGFNSFAAQAFGGIRYRFDQVEIGGHVGARLNQDGKFQLVDLQGKTSFEFAFSALFPLANQVSLVGEARTETERFEGASSSAELLAGINWRAFGRGMLRGAVSAGLTNGAPNFRVIASYAYTF